MHEGTEQYINRIVVTAIGTRQQNNTQHRGHCSKHHVHT